MKKFKIFLQIFVLACLFISCGNPSGNIPEAYGDDKTSGSTNTSENTSDSSSSSSSEPAGPSSGGSSGGSGSGESLPENTVESFPGTLTATDDGIKIYVKIPENVQTISIYRSEPNSEEINKNTSYRMDIHSDTQAFKNCFTETEFTVTDRYVTPGKKYTYKVDFFDVKWSSVSGLSVAATEIATGGEGDFTYSTMPVAAFDKNTLVLSFSVRPQYTLDGGAPFCTMTYDNWAQATLNLLEDSEIDFKKGIKDFSNKDKVIVRKVYLHCRKFDFVNYGMDNQRTIIFITPAIYFLDKEYTWERS